MADFEIIDHTADVGILAHGNTPKDVFKNAARGMFNLISEPSLIGQYTVREITVEAENQAELLVSWLNELIYLFDAENLIFGDFEIVALTENELTAKAFGERIDLSRHTIKTEIKAATYHMLKLQKENGGFSARVFLDL